MRKIKEVKVTINSGKGAVNASNHLVVLEEAGMFTVEVTEEDVYDPNEIIITAKARPKKKGVKPAEPVVPKEAPVADTDWVWVTMNNRNLEGRSKNIGLTGNKLSLRFPKVLEGGGLAWLEPFMPGDQPTNKMPNGYYISAKGEAKILDMVWREYSETYDGKIINGSVKKFNDSVQLHVYTQGLFGHDINVGLTDNGLIKDDALNVYNRGEQMLSTFFAAEVRVYKLLDDERGLNKVQDTMTNQTNNASGNKQSEYFVQKAVFDVYIDPVWKSKVGKSLEIYAKVRIPGNAVETINKKVYIEVEGQSVKNSALSMTGNTPVLVDDVPTEVNAFLPCKYTAVVLRVPEKDETTGKDMEKAIFLYKQDVTSLRTLRHFEVVTGETQGLKKITLQLSDLSTLESDCSRPAGQKHKGNVLKLLSFPEARGDAKNIKKAEKEVKSPWENTTKGGFSIFGAGSSVTKVWGADTVLEVLSHTDAEISFNSRFIYDRSPILLTNIEMPWILRYFWMSNRVAGKPYIIAASTCRHDQQIKIYPYPDVVWELALEFKNTKVKRTLVTSATYNQSAADKKKKFKSIGDRELTLALHAKWDGGEKVDLTEKVWESIETKFEKLIAVVDIVKSILSGSRNGQDPNAAQPTASQRRKMDELKRRFEADKLKNERNDLEAERQERYYQDKLRTLWDKDKNSPEYRKAAKDVANLQRRTHKKFPKLKRDVIGMEVEWPSINVAVGWSRVNTSSQQVDAVRNQTGILLTGSIEAKPLISVSVFLDFLALVQRAHPIALAVVAIVDVALSALSEDNAITCELRATGSVGGKLEGFLNTLTGENSLSPKDRKANNKPGISFTGDLELSLLIQINIQVEQDYLFVKVQGGVDASMKASAKVSARAVVDSDEKGFYTKFYSTFEGLEIVGKAKIQGSISGKIPKRQPEPGAAASTAVQPKDASLAKGEIEQGIKWQAIDKQDEVELGTIHFYPD